MIRRLATVPILLFALIMAEPAGAQQADPFAARKLEAIGLFQHGQVRPAARIFGALVKAASTPAEKVALEADLLEMCATAGEWDCVEGTVSDSLRLLQSDRNLEAYRPRILAYWAKLMVWRGNDAELERFLREAGPLPLVDPSANPADIATLHIALHGWFARRNDLKAAERSLSTAILALLRLDTRYGNYRIAQLLVDLIQSMRFAVDIVGATALAAQAEPFIAKFVPRDSAMYAQYRFETGHLSSYSANHAKTAADFSEAFQLIERLDMADDRKTYDLAIANGMASTAFALAGKLDDAKAMHARHPMQAEKAAILQRNTFRTMQEFYFAVSDVFVSSAAHTSPDLRWKPLFDKDPGWTLHEIARRELEAFRNFTRGNLAIWSSDIDGGAKFWTLAARQRIDNFDAALRANFEGFPLPSLLDTVIVSSGLFAAGQATDRDGLELMLRGSELQSRSQRHTLVDVAVLLDSQTDAEARRDAQSYIHLLRQKRAWELDQIDKLLTGRGVSDDRNELIRQYTETVTTLTALKDRLQRNPRLMPAKGLPALDDLQQSLALGSAYVTYFSVMGGIGKLCVTRDRVIHAQAELKPDLLSDARLLEFATTATYPPNVALDSQYPVAAALHLREFLFGGLEACLPPDTHVTVSLPGALLGVPLGALLAETPPRAGEGFDLAKASWVIRDFSFARVLSARQYLATIPYLRRAPAPRPYLGVGDPKLDKPHVAQLASTATVRGGFRTSNGLLELGELPETAEELNAVAALVHAPAADILTREAATEQAFRAKPLADYDVLHVASHGLLQEELPGLAESALVLTPVNSADPFNDGLLTASEISRLSLNARLVVLSACNTAKFGVETAAAGVQDLQTAFTIAGAPTLLAALWPVDSMTAREIVVGFFKEWRSAHTKGAADALARATRSFLDQADTAHQHPRFWAPFVVAGNGAVRGAPAGSR